jgi:hypothetical protein
MCTYLSIDVGICTCVHVYMSKQICFQSISVALVFAPASHQTRRPTRSNQEKERKGEREKGREKEKKRRKKGEREIITKTRLRPKLQVSTPSSHPYSNIAATQRYVETSTRGDVHRLIDIYIDIHIDR